MKRNIRKSCSTDFTHSPSVVQLVDHPSAPSACAVVGLAVGNAHLPAGIHEAVDPVKASGQHAGADPLLVSDNRLLGCGQNSLFKNQM